MDRNEIMSQYADGPMRLKRAIAELSDSNLDLARAEGKWTVRQIVHHIADAEDLWKMCIKAALGNPACSFDFSWYILDNKWADPLKYDLRPIGRAIGLFEASRLHIAELLEHVPNPWEKRITLVHQDMGEKTSFTVEEMIDWQVRHASLHVEQILETRRVHGISYPVRAPAKPNNLRNPTA